MVENPAATLMFVILNDCAHSLVKKRKQCIKRNALVPFHILIEEICSVPLLRGNSSRFFHAKGMRPGYVWTGKLDLNTLRVDGNFCESGKKNSICGFKNIRIRVEGK